MTFQLAPSVTIDFSGVKCAENVLALSTMSWPELEAHLETTARASATAFVLQPRRQPKPEKPRGGKRRWMWR
jgi:hypothetical protein